MGTRATTKKEATSTKTPVEKIALPPSLHIAPGQSDQIPPVIAKAIIAVQSELEPFVKSEQNSEYNSSFVPLSTIQPKALELLRKHGMGATQWPVSTDDDKHYLKTILFHESGVSISGELKLLLTKLDAQGLGSAITYARRYGLMSILGIVAEDDDDGNKAAGRQGRPTEEQIAEIKQLCIDLKYPTEQVQARIATLRTADHATVALNKLREQITQRAMSLNGEVKSIPVFTGSRDTVTPTGSGAVNPNETPVDALQRRLVALQLPDSTRRGFVFKLTGKPQMSNCSPDELQIIDDNIAELEAKKRDGITPPEDTA